MESRAVSIYLNQERFRQSLLDSNNPLEVFKKTYKKVHQHLNFRFEQGGNVRNLVYERSTLIDCLIHFAWHQFSWQGNVSLIAVGGYGRGELHPRSDIDILLLCDENSLKPNQKNAQAFLALLWDIGMEVGHSVRTLSECIRIAAEDVTVVTNLMESRLLQGNLDLLKQLQCATQPEKMWDNNTFFRAKVTEQSARHSKYNHTEYKLEPNVKNGPGGLRDIQTIYWVAKRFFNVSSMNELSGKGFFTEAEYATLLYGEEFLWKVRYGLHLITERVEERLLFDFQKDLAQLFGYKEDDSQLAIERFMHDYYRIVLTLRELNDVLLQFLGEAILKNQTQCITQINERFQLRDFSIELTDPNVFENHPSALLEIFVHAAQNPSVQGFRAATIRLMRENRGLIDDTFRQDPKNNELFIQLLRSPHQVSLQLRRMKRYGILGRYLPEFDRIIGQMQHDLFHIYTVDDHTLNVIEFMQRFLSNEAEEQFPFVTNVAQQLPKIELLYLAGLFHDIAKGRGGDHSSLGAVDALMFCQRLRLSRRDGRLVSWLVERHLAMSFTSQKKDLYDPEVIHAFAKLVSDEIHLDYLYVLTVADMNGTNPNIWNSWRASLLQQLYSETKRALRRGLENPLDREDCISETQELAMEQLLTGSNPFTEQAIWELWQTAGEDYFLRESSEDIVWHTSAILRTSHSNEKKQEQPLVIIKDHTPSGGGYFRGPKHKVSQIFIRTASNKNVFAAMTAVLDQMNLNIQDARIYTTVSGYSMDTFYVLNQEGLPISNSPEIIQSIVHNIHSELSLGEAYPDIIERRTPRQMKHFSSPTRTTISNELSQRYTLLEVISPDRPGFLALIARIFIELNIALVTAKISTLGERVEDVFFITDQYGSRLSDPVLCQHLQKTIEQRLDAKRSDMT